MSFTCPDCEEDLETSVREIELEEGETAQILESGALVATKVACSNGCTDKPKTSRRKKKSQTKKDRSATPADEESGDQCPRSDLCSKGPGHMGRCNTKLVERA